MAASVATNRTFKRCSLPKILFLVALAADENLESLDLLLFAKQPRDVLVEKCELVLKIAVPTRLWSRGAGHKP